MENRQLSGCPFLFQKVFRVEKSLKKGEFLENKLICQKPPQDIEKKLQIA